LSSSFVALRNEWNGGFNAVLEPSLIYTISEGSLELQATVPNAAAPSLGSPGGSNEIEPQTERRATGDGVLDSRNR
jgi:hypothetical protein